jgi:hypothetical protein
MSEIKHTFQAGKMNKDLDERLVPQGEYRDALNIEVRTSDGSDVGAVQSLYGNLLRDTHDASKYPINPTINWDGVTSEFVGSIADEKTNNAYFFVAAPPVNKPAHGSSSSITEQKLYKDMILQYSNNTKTILPVVTDIFRIELTASELSAGSGDSTNPYTKITVDSDKAKLIRPGMTIEAINISGSSLLSKYDSYIPNGLGGIKVREVSGNDIYFNCRVVGDLTYCHAWIFKAEPVLSFHRESINVSKLITGINIIDNLLFWTDNNSEPKKINIDRSQKSSTHSFDEHTDLMINNPDAYGSVLIEFATIDSNATNSELKEEHITMIRRAPRTAPNLEMSTYEGGVEIDLEGTVASGAAFIDSDGALIEISTVLTITTNGSVYDIGQLLIFESTIDDSVTSGVSATGIVESVDEDTFEHEVRISSIDQSITSVHVDWNIKLEQKKPLFELKIGRFSYRYKYQDGEYSSFAPWSELAFLPGKLDYVPKKGYNLGMVNNLRNLRITDFIVEDAQRPDDVVEVDILYKDTVSPNVYVVKSIKRGKDPEWVDNSDVGGNSGVVTITSEMIHRTLPSSQTLRAWDNVPRVARAQEVTGNRVVYGNYLQNFDVPQPVTVIQNLESKDGLKILLPNPSVKSIRNYKIGVVFGDKYGRETPVLGMGGLTETSKGVRSLPSSVSVEKKDAWRINKLTAQVDWNNWIPSDWMEYYKYYVKETTNEYYNLAMDRWYNAEDGNIWLSFQSADRNKVDIETYLILKNAHGSQDPVLEEARYKILAIENEAPDFIKTTQKILATQALGEDTDFTGIEDTMVVNFEDTAWENVLSGIEFKGIGWGRVRAIEASVVKYSKWIKIARMNETTGSITLIEPLGKSADMTTLFGVSAASDIDSWEFEIKDSVVENRPEFDGRFFVKIFRDSILNKNVLLTTASGMVYNPIEMFNFSYVASESNINDANPAAMWEGNFDSQPGVAAGTTATSNYTNAEWNHSYGLSSNEINNGYMADGCGSEGSSTYTFWKWHKGEDTNRWFLDHAAIASSADGNNALNNRHGLRTSDSGDFTQMDFSIVMTSDTPINAEQAAFKSAMSGYGTLFRFNSDPNEIVYEVWEGSELSEAWNYHESDLLEGCNKCDYESDQFCKRFTFTCSFKKLDGGLLDTDAWDPRSALRADGSTESTIEIVQAHFDLPESQKFSEDNAVWETEPKEDIGLDLYYEATNALPIHLGHDNIESFIPRESTIEVHRPSEKVNPIFVANAPVVNTVIRDVVGIRDFESDGAYPFLIAVGDILKFTHSSGMVTEAKVIDHFDPIVSYNNAATGIPDYQPSTRYNTTGAATADDTTIQIYNLGTGDLPSVATVNGSMWEVTSNAEAANGELSIPIGTFINGLSGDPVVSTGISDITTNSSISSGGTYTGQYVGGDSGTTTFPDVTITKVTGYYRLDYSTYKSKTTLPWFNCYSFGNGLESDRIRDDYNAPQIDNGVKVSTTLDSYGEEKRGSGMIYSGIYNSTSGVNNLNEFNMAEMITKDLNPSYGSLQALKTRDTNVVAFCEDKVFKILANKDALYNADGSMNVTASNAVLGDAQGFAGDFGISSNPESLAVDGYRMYFTDKQRNKVLRLSQDGLTPISDVGMTSWFRDNLNKSHELIGTFDEIKGEYNLTLKYLPSTLEHNSSLSNITASFNEKSKGWSSFKSFIPETGLSINDEYLTGKDAELWSHHIDTVYANTFYGDNYFSTIDVLFNDMPGSVKGFSTINYEGTQAKITRRPYGNVTDSLGNIISTSDGEYYNLSSKLGWYVESFNTDLQEGEVGEFKEKEGKWFHHITGVTTTLDNLDTSEFTVQGIGTVAIVSNDGFEDVTPPEPDAPTQVKLTIHENND